MRIKFCFVGSILFFISFLAHSQWQLQPIAWDSERKPIVEELKNQRINFDTTRTTEFPFFDDFSYDQVLPNLDQWVYKQGTFVNNTYAIKPPTKNVATFDGLDGNGVPYSTNISLQGLCDKLTSNYIDISNVATPCKVPTLYFAWQCGGNGEQPDLGEGDSLAVQFKNANGQWIWVWGVPAITRLDTFYTARIPVMDPQFYHPKFQFRLYSKGRMYGTYDVWNVDYIYFGLFPRINLQSIDFQDNKQGVTVGSCGTILYTTDGGNRWEYSMVDSTAQWNGVIFKNNAAVVVGSTGKALKGSWNATNGFTWTPVVTPSTNDIKAVTNASSSVLYASGLQGSILKSADFGSSWSLLSSPSTTNLNGIAMKDDNQWIAVGDSGAVWYSTDGGNSILTSNIGGSTVVKENLNAINLNGNNAFWVVGDHGKLFTSSAVGGNWVVRGSNLTENLYAIGWAGLDTAWIGGRNGSTSFSTNKGQRFTIFKTSIRGNARGIYGDGISNLWVCGDNNLLALYDKTKNDFATYGATIQTYFTDRSFVSRVPSIFKGYYSIPIKQFLANPSSFWADSSSNTIANLNNNFILVSSTATSSLINYPDKTVGDSFDFVVSVSDFLFGNSKIPLAGPVNKSKYTLSVNQSYAIKNTHYLNADDPLMFKRNDSITTYNFLDNYFAYDDGSPEFTMINNQQQGHVAVKYNLQVPDSLGALDICFLKAGKDLSNVNFNFLVWSKTQGSPYQNILFSNVGAATPVQYGNFYNRFRRYTFKTLTGKDTLIPVSDSIFVGVRQLTGDNLVLGVDINSDASSNMFYETSGNWDKYINQKDYRGGTIMIRPVFGRKGQLTALNENKEISPTKIVLYPNPTSGVVYVLGEFQKVTLYSITGAAVKEITGRSLETEIDLQDFPNGMYVVNIQLPDGTLEHHRIILQK